MSSRFKESRSRRLLEMCNSDQNKENCSNNQTENPVTKPDVESAESTGIFFEYIDPIAHCSHSPAESKSTYAVLNDMEPFSEDDDDSVKDPNYKSSSSSRSSSSSSSSKSSSSRRSSTSSAIRNRTQPIQINDQQLFGEQYLIRAQQNTDNENEENNDPLPFQESIQENEEKEGDYSIELQCAPKSRDEKTTEIICLNEIEDDSNVKKGKKRLARVDEWLSVKAKKLRNTGQSYVSRSKTKKMIPARSMKPPCGGNCKMQCPVKIRNDDRINIFTKYWQMGDINMQRSFINNCTKAIIPAVRFTGKQKPRSYNNAYYFNVRDEQIRVCKKFFMATLDINDRVIRTVFSKRELGFVDVDKRGRHGHHKKIDEAIKKSVRDHINSIPRIESHYIRKNSSREFIDGGKCIADLHTDYKKQCLERGVPAAHYEMYAKIFNQEFNISFFIPKKDRCELCVSYENADESGKQKLKDKYTLHLEEKELSRLEKEKEKASVSNDYKVAVYDLQAVLQTPKGDVSVFYYKSKLNNFNFTISELGSDHTECYLWHEGEANRGADEIGSCVLHFIEKTMADYEGPGIEFLFFSDNCCGQQKNKFIFSMYIYAIIKYPNIKSITHKYLITGHTQNEGDSVHSTIEKAIKKNLRSGPIYVPSQYAQIIKNAKKKGKPYHVNEMSYKDFFSMKSLADDIGFNAKNLKTADLKVLKVIQGEFNKVYYKHSYKDEDFKEADISRKLIIQNVKIRKAFKCRPKIKENKKRDLLSLVDNNHIPHFYFSFYAQL